VTVGLELDSGLAVAVGGEEALVVGVGVGEPDVFEVGPHATSTTADKKTTKKAALYPTYGVFMISPIQTPRAALAGE
jgi:hypothetical protein